MERNLSALALPKDLCQEGVRRRRTEREKGVNQRYRALSARSNENCLGKTMRDRLRLFSRKKEIEEGMRRCLQPGRNIARIALLVDPETRHERSLQRIGAVLVAGQPIGIAPSDERCRQQKKQQRMRS